MTDAILREWGRTEADLAGIVGAGGYGADTAREWIRQAMLGLYGVEDEADLGAEARALLLMRLRAVVADIGGDDLLFHPEARRVVRDAFQSRLGGAALTGPPWRMSPLEHLPTWGEWKNLADFGRVCAPR